MNTLVKQTMAGLRVLIVLTVITGILYPASVWLVSRVPGLHDNAEAVDTTLVGVDRQGDQWFHTRPSVATLPASGGSNKGELNPEYDKVIDQRRAEIAAREGVDPSQVPPDAITASASGLDPDISVEYANLQVARVAKVRGLSVRTVQEMVEKATHERVLGFLGEPYVNVTELNRLLTVHTLNAH
ncbi:MAG: potassium-transporting ATPase subunit C [Nocardiaceae bacterium]|nr:potassium-transporting ATPase subunit C [Nocardiaceae bacterium]